ncbi:hypothetical protein I6N90_20990 [Paenibacillus sp. GSMTC-2017]|uniref:hypothetical protein n=1 Tax=Paenibacillus sp. GSMTC-2017 TaxID=2794350 RepID=UPI0018D86E0B|nr:hypothetical protein [Paenibacillus sp. GSMTC-2017]MBH5320270.1 hypothetical protein [Paenibacillus sp. GSMTC-2017]
MKDLQQNAARRFFDILSLRRGTRTRIYLMLLVFILMIPLSTASAVGNSPATPQAGDGVWNWIGEDQLTRLGPNFYVSAPTVNSTGGDFRVCSTVHDIYTLYEADSVPNPPDYVKRVATGSDKCAVWRGIGGFVDGDNRKAEFYIVGSKSAYVWFYD